MTTNAKNPSEIAHLMDTIGINARIAARALAIAPAVQKTTALNHAADVLDQRRAEILAANAKDITAAQVANMSGAFLERLQLDSARIDAIITSLRTIAALPDPVGATIADWNVPSGLNIRRVRTPLGVIGIIFESRPNVTADAGALALKSGNAAILRGGSDSIHSSRAIHACLVDGLTAANLPTTAIQIVPTTDRAAVGEMLAGLDGNIDVIVPRGGANLVARVQADARVPVFAHLEGICHVYIDKSADLEMAVAVTLNAKMRRTSICGAAETLLIHEDIAPSHLTPICEALIAAGCEIRGDETVVAKIPGAKAAIDADWATEYNDATISVKVMKSLDAAIAHIATHSSHHTEAIIASDPLAVEHFFAAVDSAILMHNASTQFADGGEFGMGAEIGIATGKMHARGPVGVEQLTSFKYLVTGQGHTRP